MNDGEQFDSDDFGLAEKLAERLGAKAVAALVKEWHKPESENDLVGKFVLLRSKGN